MHPTGQSVDVIRKIGCLHRFFPAGDAGRYVSASRISEDARRRRAVECVVA
jgi:hypothetical protein